MSTAGVVSPSMRLPEPVEKNNLEYWEKRYKTNCLQWHINDVHPQLLKYLSQLTQQEQKNEGKPMKFFLPLCGKTKDIPFLLNLGFHVFGVEAIDAVIQDLIKENNLDLVYDESRLLYHSKDFALQIYCGDLFTCKIEEWGPFDCIWDRASLIALPYPFRPAYLETMKRAVAHGTKHSKDFRYLLQSVKYDKTKNPGPPQSVEEDDVKALFGSWADVTQLESNWVPLDHPCRKVSSNFEHDFFEEFHMFQPKTN